MIAAVAIDRHQVGEQIPDPRDDSERPGAYVVLGLHPAECWAAGQVGVFPVFSHQDDARRYCDELEAETRQRLQILPMKVAP